MSYISVFLDSPDVKNICEYQNDPSWDVATKEN